MYRALAAGFGILRLQLAYWLGVCTAVVEAAGELFAASLQMQPPTMFLA